MVFLKRYSKDLSGVGGGMHGGARWSRGTAALHCSSPCVILEGVSTSVATRAEICEVAVAGDSHISPMKVSFRQEAGNCSSNSAYARQVSDISDQGNWYGRNTALSVMTTFGKWHVFYS